MAVDIILVNHQRGRTRRVRVAWHSLRFWLPAMVLPAVIISAAFVTGRMTAPDAPLGIDPAVTQLMQDDINAQREELTRTRDVIDQNMAALARRLGRLQAHMTRINAVGSRLTELASIEAEEFDFDNEPAIGGPDSVLTGVTQQSMDELVAALDDFSNQLNKREREMRVLQELMVAGKLREQVYPSGLPVRKGWMSSGFGVRTDPFTGRRKRHSGVDFPGKVGTDVIAVAAGVVTVSGWRGGYGKLVQINHGNGYETRYGHNSKLEVKVGQRVQKGQVIAKMGSTGRSTGSHVHFEVHHNGKPVNPAQYIYAAR
ncbi:MAG: M23 family metallopeptidase [Salinisphaeraceae bacterium]|nr:M23 family metallopeptidase [Salinisphaeraceae bacterium]